MFYLTFLMMYKGCENVNMFFHVKRDDHRCINMNICNYLGLFSHLSNNMNYGKE